MFVKIIFVHAAALAAVATAEDTPARFLATSPEAKEEEKLFKKYNVLKHFDTDRKGGISNEEFDDARNQASEDMLRGESMQAWKVLEKARFVNRGKMGGAEKKNSIDVATPPGAPMGRAEKKRFLAIRKNGPRLSFGEFLEADPEKVTHGQTLQIEQDLIRGAMRKTKSKWLAPQFAPFAYFCGWEKMRDYSLATPAIISAIKGSGVVVTQSLPLGLRLPFIPKMTTHVEDKLKETAATTFADAKAQNAATVRDWYYRCGWEMKV